jgi:hypothetical protein
VTRRFSLLMLLALAAAAAAQSQSAALPAPERRLYDTWELRFEPSVWYVSPGGRFNLPGEPAGTAETWLSDLNLDSPRASPYGELHLKASEDWRFILSAFALEEDSRGAIAAQPGFVGPHAYATGDPLESSFSLASAEAVAAWRLPFELGRRYADFEGRVELIGGFRAISMDLDLAAPAGSVSHDSVYIEPVFGMRANFEIMQRFTCDLQNTFGYFSDGEKRSATWDITVGFMYFPLENVGVQVGYRQILLDTEEGEGEDRFQYHGAAAGIFAGATIRF